MSRSIPEIPLSRLLVLVCILIWSIGTLHAQIINVTGDQASPVEGAGHDYIKMLNETVNPATGSVSIRISVPTSPARGVTVPFSFGYDSNAALHFTPKGDWQDNTGFLSQGGWSYLLPNLISSPNVVASQNGTSLCYYFTDYMFTDLGGSSHGLYISPRQPLDGTGCTSYNGAPNNNLVNQLNGGDAQVQASTGTAGFRFQPAVSVADTDGSVYSFSSTTQGFVTNMGNSWEIFPSTVEDRNGNQATFTATQSPLAVTVTDDLGRTVLSISGFGSTGNTVAVPSLSGPYTLTWGTFAESSTFPWIGQKTQWGGCTMIDNGGGPNSAKVTAIALPDGNSYQFQYDPITGLLSKLIYPSGGYVRYVWGLTSTVFDAVS